jgi:hypothetical protein
MLDLKPGDSVTCRISSSTIVSPYKSYDELKTFIIVAIDNYDYYLYVPHYCYLTSCVLIDEYLLKNLKIERRFLNENIICIQESLIASVEYKRQGLNCKICNEFFPWAKANQEDKSLICFCCRQNSYR